MEITVPENWHLQGFWWNLWLCPPEKFYGMIFHITGSPSLKSSVMSCWFLRRQIYWRAPLRKYPFGKEAFPEYRNIANSRTHRSSACEHDFHRGSNLLQGQKRIIEMLRAVYCDFDMIVFYEPLFFWMRKNVIFSDPWSERTLQTRQYWSSSMRKRLLQSVHGLWIYRRFRKMQQQIKKKFEMVKRGTQFSKEMRKKEMIKTHGKWFRFSVSNFFGKSKFLV